MKKLLSASIGAALAATMAVSSVVPASAQSFNLSVGQRDQVVSRFCERNPRNDDCRDYRRGGWDRNDYDSFYRRNRGGLDNIAAGLFGFTFGAIIAGAIANNRRDVREDRVYVEDDHIARCEARYRSYDWRTDTFLGYDGQRHYCNL